jgi:hypothetical protein
MKSFIRRTIPLGGLTVAVITGVWLAFVDRAIIFLAIPYALWFGHYLGRTSDLTWKDVAYATLKAAGSTLGLSPIGAFLAAILVSNGAPHGELWDPVFSYLEAAAGSTLFAVLGYCLLHWLASLFRGRRS